MSFWIQKIGQKVVDRVREQMAAQDRNATGRTSKRIRYEVNGNRLTVFAPFYIQLLNDGRPPTRVREGRGELVKALIDWCKARGIPVSARFAIAKKIHKEGYDGDQVVNNTFTNELIDEIREEARINMRNIIFQQLGFESSRLP